MQLTFRALSTDVMIAKLWGEVEDHGEYLRLSTPKVPAYELTNGLIFKSAPADAEGCLDLLAQHFPNVGSADGLRLAWNSSEDPSAELTATLDAAGYTKIPVLGMVTASPRPGRPEIEVRSASTNADWATVLDTSLSMARPEKRWQAEPHHASILAGLRELCDTGHGAFLTGWLDGRCVGLVGVVLAGETARLQWVYTRKEFTGKGVCRTLVAAAARWGLDHGARRVVVVAFPSNAAALKAYRAAGFRACERQTWFWRRKVFPPG